MHGKTGLDMTPGARRSRLAGVNPAPAAKRLMAGPVRRVAARRGAAAGARAADVAAPLLAALAPPCVGPLFLPRVPAEPPQGLRALYGKAALAEDAGGAGAVQHRAWARKNPGRPNPRPGRAERGMKTRPSAISDARGHQAGLLQCPAAARGCWGKDCNPTARRAALPSLARPAPRLIKNLGHAGQSPAHGMLSALHAPFIMRPRPSAEHGPAALSRSPAPRGPAGPAQSRAGRIAALPGQIRRQADQKRAGHSSVSLGPERAWAGHMPWKGQKKAAARKSRAGFSSGALRHERWAALPGAAVEIAPRGPRICSLKPEPRPSAALQMASAPVTGLRQAGPRGFSTMASAGRAQAPLSRTREGLPRLPAISPAARGAASVPAGLRRTLLAAAGAEAALPRAGAASGTPRGQTAASASAPGSAALPVPRLERNRAAALNGAGAYAAHGASPLALTANFSFQINGISDEDLARRVMAALESSKGDVERLLSEIVHNQMRVSYAG